MQVKALDHIEDVNQVPEPDGNGGFNLRSVVTVMTAGESYTLDDAHAQRLLARGLVSQDMNASLLPHLVAGTEPQTVAAPAPPAPEATP